MKPGRLWLLSGLVVVALTGALWGLNSGPPNRLGDPVGGTGQGLAGAGARQPGAGADDGRSAEPPELTSPFGSGPPREAWGIALPEPVVTVQSPLESVVLPTFKANANGGAELSPNTLMGVERIHALFSPEVAIEKLAQQAAGLPAAAQRELAALLQQYSVYAQAQSQSLPPTQTDLTYAEARAELNALKQLRRHYFGPETGDALFGEDERGASEMLDQMEKAGVTLSAASPAT